MNSDSSPERKKFYRRRRKNIEGKVVRVNISMSEAERAALYRIELETQRTASEILVSAALSADVRSSVDTRALASELLQLRFELSKEGNNLNQIARHANSTGEISADLQNVLTEIRGTLLTLNAALSELE